MTALHALLIGLAILQLEGADAGAADAGPPPAPPPVRPTVPGEPVIDPTLPAGTLIVELRDARGAPMAAAALIVESSAQGGSGRRLKTETDDTGKIRVEDLPTGEEETIAVGHEGSSGVLTSTRPFALPADAGARVLLRAPGRTDDPSAVELKHLHVVLDRKGPVLRVTETLGLGVAAGVIFARDEGFSLPAPTGVEGLRFKDPESAANKARIGDGEIVVTAPIPPGGLELSVVFDVPIEGGRADLEHGFTLAVGSTQVISTWTQGGTKLTVEGFDAAEPVELRSGLTALVAAAGELPAGRLKLALEGIADGPAALRRVLTLFSSVLILGFGLVLWIIGRARREPRGESDDR
jgi:hypothetical protein